MPRLTPIALLILVVSAGVSAGPVMLSAGVSASQQSASKPTTAAVAGVSRERLKRLDAVLQEQVDRNRIAGIVVLVLRDGKPIYERALGWSDKESNRPMKVDSIFRIASQTKALTSAAILALMDDGRLTPSMPVSRFIPAYAKTTVAVKGDAGVATVPARRPDHDRRPADAHGRHLVRHRQPGRGRVRGEGLGAGGRVRLVHSRQG